MNKCPHCKGDRCDPHDYSTAIVNDCPVCDGSGVLSPAQIETYNRGMVENWTWERYYAESKK